MKKLLPLIALLACSESSVKEVAVDPSVIKKPNQSVCEELGIAPLHTAQRNIYFSCTSSTADERQCDLEKRSYLAILHSYKENGCGHLIKPYYFGE